MCLHDKFPHLCHPYCEGTLSVVTLIGLCYIIFLKFDYDIMEEISKDKKQANEVIIHDIFPSL